MRFLFFEPFCKIAGREITIRIDRPVALGALIGRLPPGVLEMIPHGETVSDVALRAHVMFFADGRLLKLKDAINVEDDIKVMLPAMGG